MKNAINKILEINGIVKSLNPALQERASDVLIKMAFGNLLQEANRTAVPKKRSPKLELHMRMPSLIVRLSLMDMSTTA
ncbi:MAG: hypothetical protein GWO81_07800 [Verrucomicrobia bacterium]|nr:hypothetical protein [Verrucomicrobiota bacterium]